MSSHQCVRQWAGKESRDQVCHGFKKEHKTNNGCVKIELWSRSRKYVTACTAIQKLCHAPAQREKVGRLERRTQ